MKDKELDFLSNSRSHLKSQYTRIRMVTKRILEHMRKEQEIFELSPLIEKDKIYDSYELKKIAQSLSQKWNQIGNV